MCRAQPPSRSLSRSCSTLFSLFAIGDNEKKPDFTFSEEDQDEKIVELKTDGGSWKSMAQRLKKPQGALKKRLNEIAPAEANFQGNLKDKSPGWLPFFGQGIWPPLSLAG
ncbi:hypothetical protein UCRNP2_703 [Neofusicoccum parvum UCRNP2]|uniref:Uncharacterized protein n=1 Tax=Botryosphaeria parva (strain UCR-NP2) TaxID=1287680 RepID=R1EXP5_BOTPV|nr:hypothetical protein UCRNP2_703 [Neofusicoccum parvum UCRNP2]